MDTIFALSSAPGKAGISVFRISGPKSLLLLKKLTRESHFTPRMCYTNNIYDFRNGKYDLIDCAVTIFFAAPKSFTGEDVLEIHTHGGNAIKEILTEVVLNEPNVRYADPGEFTKRAFLNKKIDLTQAEGISDLIEADTKLQHVQAVRQMSGALQKLYSKWRNITVEIMALLTALIDFPEDDVPDTVLTNISQMIKTLIRDLKSHLSDNRNGERLRSGIKLGIFGAPNTGKSSLTNLLTKNETSIVTHIAGTTRDVVVANINLEGYPISIIDTAGVRESVTDLVEKIGIKKAKDYFAKCDIKIILADPTEQCFIPEELKQMQDNNTIVAINKIDLVENYNEKDTISISCLKKLNIGMLIKEIVNKAKTLAYPTHDPLITRSRHRVAILKALNCLENSLQEQDFVIKAQEIQNAHEYLKLITGTIHIEEVLEKVFKNFCIGK